MKKICYICKKKIEIKNIRECLDMYVKIIVVNRSL